MLYFQFEILFSKQWDISAEFYSRKGDHWHVRWFPDGSVVNSWKTIVIVQVRVGKYDRIKK